MSQTPLEVLVADDCEEICEWVAHCLKSVGYVATFAHTGREAMRLIERRHFHLLVTDVIMPEADGIEVLAEARKRSPSTRIVVITGGGNVVDPQYCATLAAKMGAHATLLKPFRPQELIEVVNRVAS